MKRIIFISIALLSGLLYWFSSDNRFMLKLYAKRIHLDSPFGSDREYYGDLYSFCYLPQFKINDPILKNIQPDTIKNIKRDINLYTICDSYLFNFIKTDLIFHGVKRYWFCKSGGTNSPLVKMDTTQKNILIIESTERFVRNMANADAFTKLLQPVASTGFADTTATDFKKTPAISFPVLAMIFNPRISQTLEFNLFDYKFFSPLKEWKAALNYNLFNRANKEVKISPDGKHLFLVETVDSTSTFSSFKRTDDKDIDYIVASLNKIYAHYKALGFDEVYLSMIPNPVTIIAPEMGNYNHLISRIQENPDLKMPYIDMYKKFKATKENIYQPTDTHWNNRGFKLWVDEFNKTLAVAYPR
ncbi:MAG: hypothetical protein ABIN95_09985 [Mucilaginibacter sp.]